MSHLHYTGFSLIILGLLASLISWLMNSETMILAKFVGLPLIILGIILLIVGYIISISVRK